MANLNDSIQEISIGTASQVLEATIKAGIATLLVGRPGVGKTASVQQVAERLGCDLWVWYAAEADPTDIKGLPAVVDGRARFLVFSDLEQLLNATKPTIAFFDEIGQAPKSVQAPLMHVLHARTIGGRRIPDCVQFVGATNSREDKAGVEQMLEPFKDRWTVTLHVRSDLKEWTRWALTHEIDEQVVAFAAWRPEYLSSWKPCDGFAKTATARGLEGLSRVISAGIPKAAEYAVFEGIVGRAAAAEFISFRALYSSLPDVDACIKEPTKCELPKENAKSGLAVMYAFAGAVAARGTAKNADAIWKLTKRLPREIGALLWSMMIERKREICSTKAFIEGYAQEFGGLYV